jgi:outer membrane receptor protein involved in Fe transport
MELRWPSLVSTTALVSTIFLMTPECVQAQDAANSVPKDNNLPAIRIEAPPAPRPAQRTARERGGESSRNRSAAQHPTPQHVTVSAPTPLPGPSQVPLEKAFDADKVPGTITTIDTSQIERTNSLNVTDSLQHYVPGVSASSVGGNEFQPNVDFRGYVASPVSGTPQGLAVYQNGVRINEAFGDTMNWDLIPTAAIRSVTMVTNNPAYGLNALGGALNIQMKDGFNYHGAEIDVMGGSYGRVQSSLQWGKQINEWAIYGAFEAIHDDGYRLFSESNILRFYGDIGHRTVDSEIHLNMGAANNTFGAAATSPVELLQTAWNADYTTPQASMNQVGYLNLTGRFDVSPTWTVDANAHYRAFSQHTQDANPSANGVQPCAADATLLCNSDGSPTNGLNGQQLSSSPFSASSIIGENDRTSTSTTTLGTTLQATNTDKIFGLDNRFTVGTSFDRSVTHFSTSAELGSFTNSYQLVGSGQFLGTDNPQDGPVGLRTTNQFIGVYALDSIDLTKRLTVTGGGRFNVANVDLQDQIGGPTSLLNGNNNYTRFNPMLGGTYKITSELTAYGGYSEANRVPTPLELGCADPTHPCILATFLVSDPPLQQVVSHTWEAGFRGSHSFGADFGTLTWKVGAFHAINTNDILSIPAPNDQGFGFFSNVGSTRRQGIEADAKLTAKRFDVYASYSLVDARFLDSLQLASNSPAVDANGNIQVSPGNQIPAIPRHRVKVGFDYAATDAFKFGADVVYMSSQYFVGDASNQEPQLPGYTVVNLHASYRINQTYQIYGRVDNVFNNHYATYATFFDTTQLPNFNTGNPFTNPDSLSPARPLAAYVGIKATF